MGKILKNKVEGNYSTSIEKALSILERIVKILEVLF
jgi:hypothetical protein